MGTGRRFDFTVTSGEARMRLDLFLAMHKRIATRSQVQRWIRVGRVAVDGTVACRCGTLLRPGQRVDVECPAVETPSIVAEEIPLDVLYEDAELLAINKPAGLVVHPAPGNWSGTVVNAVLHKLGDAAAQLDAQRPGIVHRLDKDTSGVLVIARDAAAHARLAGSFQQRKVHKQYLALVWGRVKQARGIVRQPIGRHPTERKRMTVRAGGREAVTRYEVVERFAQATLVRAFPETGRTHQIRVHFASIGHPIVGDAAYGGRRRDRESPIGRQALHAEAIEFQHPGAARTLRIAAPPPDDFERAILAFREGCAA